MGQGEENPSGVDMDGLAETLYGFHRTWLDREIPKMSPGRFAELEAKLVAHEKRVLTQRTEAYGDPDNQLQNFDAIAKAAEIPPELVWIVLWQKGLQTITKLMRGENVPGEVLEDRFADARNYLLLGYAMKMRSLERK